MSKRIAFIHTVTNLPVTFKTLCSEIIPGVDTFHIVDESLLQNTIRAGKLSALTARRLLGHLVSAQDAGADLMMVTCSSVGQAVEWSRNFLDVPVLRVDEAMAELAVASGMKIGIIATLGTTLTPTAALIQSKAAEAKKVIDLRVKLCEGAFEAMAIGDTARHDALVTSGLREIIQDLDIIVLAQASMARVVDSLPAADRPIPILSSPRLAVERLALEYNRR